MLDKPVLRGIPMLFLLATAPAIGQDADEGVQIFQTPLIAGHIDATGILLKPQIAEWLNLVRFQDGLAAVQLKNPDPQPKRIQQWGFIDASGKLAIPSRFQMVEDFSEGLAAVNEGGFPNLGVDFIWGCPMVDRTGSKPRYPMIGGKWGFINRQGKTVIPLQFDEANSFSDGLARVMAGAEYRFLKPDGETAFRCSAEMRPGDFREGLAAVIVGLWPDWKKGYLDRSGQLAVPLSFDSAHDFSEGLACVCPERGGKWGFIDKTGAIVIAPRFDRPFSFHEGCGVVEADGRFGFVDTRGQWIIPPRFEAVHDFREGLAPVKLNGRWGYIDRTGNQVIAPQFVGAGLFRDGIARVAIAGIERGGRYVQEGTWGFIDKSGKWVLPAVYDWASDFWEGRAVVYRYPKSGFKDGHGGIILEAEYFLCNHRAGLLTAGRNGKCGIVEERTGEIIVPLQFDWAECIAEGIIVVRRGRLSGLVDRQGRFIVEPKYYNDLWFHEGLAAVNVDPESGGIYRAGKYGFIDMTGRMVIEPQFADASSFSDGLAAVAIRPSAATNRKDSAEDSQDELLYGYIDATGKMVIQPQFAAAGYFKEGLAPVQSQPVGDEDQGRWGYINREGKWVIEPKFDRADWFEAGRAKVRIDFKEFHVDRQGSLERIK